MKTAVHLRRRPDARHPLPPAPTDHSTATFSGPELILLGLEGLLALGAFFGAMGLITGGLDLGEGLARLPFQSAVFAGWALALVNGVLPAAVIIGARRRRAWSGWGHVVVGAALVGWIVVQVSLLGPPLHWLQILYFVWGGVILTLALRLRGRRPRRGR